MNDFPNIDLSVLTARQREVIEMHYSSCLSFGAIALFLHCTLGAVKQCHRRAIRTLRRTMPVPKSHI